MQVPSVGSVSFHPTIPFYNAVDNIILDPSPIVARLDRNGYVYADLVASDDPSLSPTNLSYTVTENIRNAPVRAFLITVPVALAVPGLSLSDVSPLIPGPQGYGYALQGDVTALTGRVNALSSSGGAGVFTYSPGAASSAWLINHNLGRIPDVTILLPSGEQVITDIAHPTINQTIITWQGPTLGTAYLR